MNADRYRSNIEYFKENKTAYNVLKTLYKFLPALIFFAYPVMLIVKGILGFDPEFFLMLCVPAGTLVIVSIMRKLINRKRPYEKYETSPLFERDGKGESFPSRHTASAFIIAMSGFALDVWLGISLLVISAIIGLTRHLSGVHYISDVLAGAALSLIIGTVFFIIL